MPSNNLNFLVLIHWLERKAKTKKEEKKKKEKKRKKRNTEGGYLLSLGDWFSILISETKPVAFSFNFRNGSFFWQMPVFQSNSPISPRGYNKEREGEKNKGGGKKRML